MNIEINDTEQKTLAVLTALGVALLGDPSLPVRDTTVEMIRYLVETITVEELSTLNHKIAGD